MSSARLCCALEYLSHGGQRFPLDLVIDALTCRSVLVATGIVVHSPTVDQTIL